MRLRGLGEREGLVYSDFQLTGCDPFEQIIRPLHQLSPVGGVVRQKGAGQEDRAFRIQDLRV